MRSLERIVSAYLDLAEDRAERHIPMTMEDWSKRLDLFLMADDREVLQDAGKITAEIAKAKAETEFEKCRVIQDRLFMSDFDKYLLELPVGVYWPIGGQCGFTMRKYVSFYRPECGESGKLQQYKNACHYYSSRGYVSTVF